METMRFPNTYLQTVIFPILTNNITSAMASIRGDVVQ